MPKKDPDASRFDIPEGRRPEEFLNDADLALYHQRQLDAAKESDPDYPALKARHAKAVLAAAMTDAAVAEAEAQAAAELDQ